MEPEDHLSPTRVSIGERATPSQFTTSRDGAFHLKTEEITFTGDTLPFKSVAFFSDSEQKGSKGSNAPSVRFTFNGADEVAMEKAARFSRYMKPHVTEEAKFGVYNDKLGRANVDLSYYQKDGVLAGLNAMVEDDQYLSRADYNTVQDVFQQMDADRAAMAERRQTAQNIPQDESPLTREIEEGVAAIRERSGVSWNPFR